MNVHRFDPTEKFTPEEMAQVRARSDVTGTLCILHAWTTIAASMALFALWPNPLTFIFAVVLIGSRQLGLAILMHDGAHGVLMKTHAWNERASQWLCAFPVFTDTLAYRHYHLRNVRSPGPASAESCSAISPGKPDSNNAARKFAPRSAGPVTASPCVSQPSAKNSEGRSSSI
jgi:hypothetical protein